MKIGILTGGGDVPGLNACVKAVVNRVIDGGHKVVGIRRGWGGLLACEPGNLETVQENTVLLNRELVRTIDRSGGTFLHTSRTNPVNVPPASTVKFPNRSNNPVALTVIEPIELISIFWVTITLCSMIMSSSEVGTPEGVQVAARFQGLAETEVFVAARIFCV